MSSEEFARDILTIFQRNGIGPGAALTSEGVKLAFFSDAGRVRTQSEFDEGLRYATQQGWLQSYPQWVPPVIRLTETGFARSRV